MFTDGDSLASADESGFIVVNETWRKRCGPAAGIRSYSASGQAATAPWLRAIGAVADNLSATRALARSMPPPPLVLSTMSLAVKTAGDPPTLISTDGTIVREGRAS